MKKTYRQLSFQERSAIEVLFATGSVVRAIAKFLGRSPNTVARELRKNTVKGNYTAEKATTKASQRRWRAKGQCMKVAMDSFLARFVEEKLEAKWSPKQISGHLQRELQIQCSAKAIYKFAESRGLDHLLFWGWNNHKGGRKRGHWKTAHDGRHFINERPPTEGVGHFEVDFIVSRDSSWVLLVVVDTLTKHTWVRKLPNRKRTTIRRAFSELFAGVPVQSITTDNDIAFTCWKELEELLHTRVYFTHPYHSWEKGLVENTNRWIRCFVLKRRDIALVTEEELDRIHSYLNDRPREIVGFRVPSEYYQFAMSVLLQG